MLKTTLMTSLMLSASLFPAMAQQISVDPDPERQLEPAYLGQAGSLPLRVDMTALAGESPVVRIDAGTWQATAHRLRQQHMADGSHVWEGIVVADGDPVPHLDSLAAALNSATLILHDGRLTGALRKDGELFRIHALANGRQVLERAVMPAERRLDHGAVQAMTSDATRNVQASDADEPVVIRVLVVGSTPAREAYPGDLGDLVRLEIAESNRSFERSGIGIKLELADYQPIDYVPIGGDPVDTDALVDPNDGRADEIHPMRDASAADLVMMINSADDAGWCGWAAVVGASAETAFAHVNWKCMGGNFSFVHELGHLLGARHNVEIDPTEEPYPFGHGYLFTTASKPQWRTIMSYDCDESCPRLGYWSNPDIALDGDPMGTKELQDNHRVLQLTRHEVAGFR